MIDFASSSGFNNLLNFVSIFMALAAVSLAIFSVIEYRNSFRYQSDDTADDPWVVLFETMRDSFLISAIYVSIDYLRQSNALSANDFSVGVPTLVRIISPFIELVIFGIAAMIILKRLFALRRWLELRRKK